MSDYLSGGTFNVVCDGLVDPSGDAPATIDPNIVIEMSEQQFVNEYAFNYHELSMDMERRDPMMLPNKLTFHRQNKYQKEQSYLSSGLHASKKKLTFQSLILLHSKIPFQNPPVGHSDLSALATSHNTSISNQLSGMLSFCFRLYTKYPALKRSILILATSKHKIHELKHNFVTFFSSRIRL